MGKACDDIDFNKVKANKTLCISSKFDLREWWLHSRSNHSIVYVAVPTLVSLPNSNAFQERTFSTCTYFDDPLRQRLKRERFEMAVLLAVNEALLKTEVPSEADAKQIVSKVLATFEKSPLVLDATEMLGLDPRG